MERQPCVDRDSLRNEPRRASDEEAGPLDRGFGLPPRATLPRIARQITRPPTSVVGGRRGFDEGTRVALGMHAGHGQGVEFGDPSIEILHASSVFELGDDRILDIAQDRGVDRFPTLVFPIPNEIGELVDEIPQIHVSPPSPGVDLACPPNFPPRLTLRRSAEDFLQVCRKLYDDAASPPRASAVPPTTMPAPSICHGSNRSPSSAHAAISATTGVRLETIEVRVDPTRRMANPQARYPNAIVSPPE